MPLLSHNTSKIIPGKAEIHLYYQVSSKTCELGIIHQTVKYVGASRKKAIIPIDAVLVKHITSN